MSVGYSGGRNALIAQRIEQTRPKGKMEVQFPLRAQIIIMYKTHSKGILGELAFTYRLIEKGFTVLTPINQNSSYDIVTEKDGKFMRIQVKYRTPVNGTLRVELYRPLKPNELYFGRGVDAMGLYDPLNRKFYLIPLSVINTKSEFRIRIDKPKGKRSKSMHFAKEFEI